MPYEYILANLLAENDKAVGVLFLDDSGETIDLACADASPYQMKVAGAYLGIYLRQLSHLTERLSLGKLELLHIAREPLHTFALTLPEGYFLALVQRHPALVGKARLSLEKAGEELRRALFR